MRHRARFPEAGLVRLGRLATGGSLLVWPLVPYWEPIARLPLSVGLVRMILAGSMHCHPGR
jgi:hypothetical protein